MILHNLEPLIILPYKDKQDILFFSGNSIKNYSGVLKDMVYSELSNKIIKDNLIKVKVGFNYVIILHIYPSDYKEKCSGRGGQNLIIGYIIRKKELITNFNTIIYKIETFFESVKMCAGKNVPTDFLLNVNNGNELRIIEKLDCCIRKIYSIWRGGYHCFALMKNPNRVCTLHLKKVKINKVAQGDSIFRLRCVYEYILKQSIINKEIWILVDCKDVRYYDLKNIHLINFIENNN